MVSWAGSGLLINRLFSMPPNASSRRDGAANLTIDAVARRSGRQQGKRTLRPQVRAGADRSRRRPCLRARQRPSCRDGGTGSTTPRIELSAARSSQAAGPPPEEFRAVALNLSAALALDAGREGRCRTTRARTIARDSRDIAMAARGVAGLSGARRRRNSRASRFHHFTRGAGQVGGSFREIQPGSNASLQRIQ